MRKKRGYSRLVLPSQYGDEACDILVGICLVIDVSSLLEPTDRESIGRRLRHISFAITEFSQINTMISGANIRLNTTV